MLKLEKCRQCQNASKSWTTEGPKECLHGLYTVLVIFVIAIIIIMIMILIAVIELFYHCCQCSSELS